MLSARVFVGLDMVDGSRPSPRPVDLALLDESLECAFEQWAFRCDGRGLFPDELGPPGFVLAIDGPQGLAGEPGKTMRECEREGGTPGKSPYDFPQSGPYAGYVSSSVRLFAVLWRSRKFDLHGFAPSGTGEASLIEVYPGNAWKTMSQETGLPLTVKKQRRKGRQERTEILAALGLRMPVRSLPTHDQLDAALAALTALRYTNDQFRDEGTAPFWDGSRGVLREGFIVYPREDSTKKH